MLPIGALLLHSPMRYSTLPLVCCRTFFLCPTFPHCPCLVKLHKLAVIGTKDKIRELSEKPRYGLQGQSRCKGAIFTLLVQSALCGRRRSREGSLRHPDKQHSNNLPNGIPDGPPGPIMWQTVGGRHATLPHPRAAHSPRSLHAPPRQAVPTGCATNVQYPCPGSQLPGSF